MNGIGDLIRNPQISSRFMKPAMLLTFLGVLLVFGIISVILNYHWTQYGVNKEKLAKIRRIYFGVSAILLLAITGLLLSIYI